MALNGRYCADVLLTNYSLTLYVLEICHPRFFYQTGGFWGRPINDFIQVCPRPTSVAMVMKIFHILSQNFGIYCVYMGGRPSYWALPQVADDIGVVLVTRHSSRSEVSARLSLAKLCFQSAHVVAVEGDS